MRHVVVDHRGTHVGSQKSEFVSENNAVAGDEAWRKGVVVVRCNVPIDGLCIIKTQLGTHADRRRQKTALTVGADREKCIG